jgi:hypothetical protein
MLHAVPRTGPADCWSRSVRSRWLNPSASSSSPRAVLGRLGRGGANRGCGFALAVLVTPAASDRLNDAMGAVVFRAGTDVRSRLTSALLLAIAIGVAAGVTLTALAGARRTNSAVDRFVAYTQPEQGIVAADPGLYSQIARLPQVAASARVARFGMARIDSANRLVRHDSLGELATDDLSFSRPIVVSGRLPRSDRIDEVAVNVSAAQNTHLKVGNELRFRAYAPTQVDALFAGGSVEPTGPVVVARVVGIIRTPTDLSTAQASPGVTYTGQDTATFTPAFLRAYVDKVAVAGGVFLAFRLHADPTALRSFEADVARLGAGKASVFLGSDEFAAAAQARHATNIEALALLLFGILAGVVTLTLIAQAFARRVYLDAGEYSTLRAMGMTRKQLVAGAAIRAALISILGGLLALGVSILASPRMPIGLARQAEIHRGYSIDGPVLSAGICVIAAILTGWTALVTWRATRHAGATASRYLVGGGSSRIARALIQGWSPPSVTVGAGMAFDSGRGSSAVPVRTALTSAVTALAVVAGTLTFGANLSRLAGRPELQGWNWDVAVGNPHSDDVAKTAIPVLAQNPTVAAFSAIAGASAVPARIDGHDAAIFGIEVVKGPDLVPYTAGRAPQTADEIAFGAKTMRDWHLAIGQRVQVSTGGPTQSMIITGRVLLTPSVVNDSVPLGQAAVVTNAAIRALQAQAPVNVFLVRFGQNIDRPAAIERLRADFPGTVLGAVRPPDIENLRRVDHLPGLLAGLFALIALLTVGNTLVTSVRRRRRELAVLRAMGFVRRQVAATVAWQATMVAVVAIVVGVPVGAVAGRATWTLVTERLGLPANAIVPGSLLLVVALGALVAANLIAVVPGLLATQTQPATILHTE